MAYSTEGNLIPDALRDTDMGYVGHVEGWDIYDDFYDDDLIIFQPGSEDFWYFGLMASVDLGRHEPMLRGTDCPMLPPLVLIFLHEKWRELNDKA